MGYGFAARCNQCGTAFIANQGGGLVAASFHCGRCGKERRVMRFEGEAPVPCSCGGSFSLEAGPRCPKCRSDDWAEDFDSDFPGIMWD